MDPSIDVQRLLGRLEGQLEGLERSIVALTESVEAERQSASESRAGLHRRLDEQVDRIARLETNVAISGKIEAQVRDRLAAVEASAADWQQLKTMSRTVTWLLLASGVTVGGALAWTWDAVLQWIRHVLRLPG